MQYLSKLGEDLNPQEEQTVANADFCNIFTNAPPFGAEILQRVKLVAD